MIGRRWELRNTPTKAEAYLWEALRNNQLNGHRFRRQHGIGRLIVDFYHGKTRTVIEVDGGIHDDDEVLENDAKRQEELEGMGYTVLRFANSEIMEKRIKVLQVIDEYLQKKILIPLFSPDKGRGSS